MDPVSIHHVNASLSSALASLTPTSFSFNFRLHFGAAMSAFRKPAAAKPTKLEQNKAKIDQGNNNNKTKAKKRLSLTSLLPRRTSAAVSPRCPSPVDSAYGSIERPVSPVVLAAPAAYCPPAYGSSTASALDLTNQVPECLTHSLAVVERWLIRAQGLYRIHMSTLEANALVESWYDPKTGARLASAPEFDVDSPATRDLAGAYAHLARARLRRAHAGVLPMAAFRAVVAEHLAGAGSGDVASVVVAAAAQIGHEHVLRVILAHLSKVASEAKANLMTGDAVMRVWAMALLAADGIDLALADLADLAKLMAVFCAAMGPVVEAFGEEQ